MEKRGFLGWLFGGKAAAENEKRIVVKRASGAVRKTGELKIVKVSPAAGRPSQIMEEPVLAESIAPAAKEPVAAEPAPAEIPATAEPAPAVGEPAPVAAPPTSKKFKTYKVAGVSYRLKNIMELAVENEEYSYNRKQLIEEELTGQRVWKYVFCTDKVELVPEPDNPQDPNAIKVIIDGLHVGYIKTGSCAHMQKVLREGRIGKIEAVVGGGPYKYVGCVDYTEDGDEVYGSMERDDVPYYVRLEVEEK